GLQLASLRQSPFFTPGPPSPLYALPVRPIPQRRNASLSAFEREVSPVVPPLLFGSHLAFGSFQAPTACP
ncbi:MAG: hypothetical protein PUD47_09075, partial [Bacteroidales bacterium]|nr:hypothetical protein [Bacteroidales bacterium]